MRLGLSMHWVLTDIEVMVAVVLRLASIVVIRLTPELRYPPPLKTVVPKLTKLAQGGVWVGVCAQRVPASPRKTIIKKDRKKTGFMACPALEIGNSRPDGLALPV